MRNVRDIILPLGFVAFMISLPLILQSISEKLFWLGINVFEKYIDYSDWPPALIIALFSIYAVIFFILAEPVIEPYWEASKKKKKCKKQKSKK